MTAGLLGSILIILFLLCLSGFFSGSETALTAVSRARMHSFAKEGRKGAIIVNKIRERKDRMIGALLLGNNLVNILASALATSVLIEMVGEAGVIYATAIMTLMVLIFAEVLPKTYALHHADTMAMRIAPIIAFVMKIFGPITELVTHIVRFVLKLLGADVSMVKAGSHVEVLRGIIELHRGPEQETDQQRAMLRSILDLGDVTVEEVMTHRKNVAMIDSSLPTEKIIEEVLDSPFTRMPIWKDDTDNITGIIHVKALLKALQANGGKASKVDIQEIAAEPWFVPESTPLFAQLQAFKERREHFAVVVDEYGSFMGIVTLEDILEEIVGEIDDELDEIVAGVRKQPNGSFLIDGTVTIRDLNREFEWDLPDDEDYSTLAGLILHEAQMVPDIGQAFKFYDFNFEVVRKQRNQITVIRVRSPKKRKEDESEAA